MKCTCNKGNFRKIKVTDRNSHRKPLSARPFLGFFVNVAGLIDLYVCTNCGIVKSDLKNSENSEG